SIADRSETAPQMFEFHLVMLFTNQRYKLDGRGLRLGAHSRVDDACSVAAVLCAIGSIDLFVDSGIRFFHKGDLFYNPPGPDLPLVACLNTTEPCGCP